MKRILYTLLFLLAALPAQAAQQSRSVNQAANTAALASGAKITGPAVAGLLNNIADSNFNLLTDTLPFSSVSGTLSSTQFPNIITPGTVGSSTTVPVVSFNSTGRLTSVTSATISGGGGGSGTVNSGTAGNGAYYAGTGTAVSPEPNVSDLSNTWTYGSNGVTGPALSIIAATNGTGLSITSAAASGGTALTQTGGGALKLNTGSTSDSVTVGPGGTARYTFANASFTMTPFNSSSATTARFLFTAATDNPLTTATEAPEVFFNLGATRTHASGNISLQRDFNVTCGTHAFSAASTIAEADCVYISGAPAAGTNATLTQSFALNVNSGMVKFGGGFQPNVWVITTGASYTATVNDNAIFVNKGTGGATSVVLPACSTAYHGEFIVADEKGDAGTNNITITAASGTVKNGASLVEASANQSVHLRCDGVSNYVPE